MADIVDSARRSRLGVRVAGSGHSNTPIVETPHTLLNLERMSGVVETNRDAQTAVIRAGTRLADIGEPLWLAGLALKNQGDIDSQTLAGATATGTKGSGVTFGSISSNVRALRLVTGAGETLVVDGADPDLLHAAQVSLGLLGVVTELTMDVAAAYCLREFCGVMPIQEVLDCWDEAPGNYRHFSFLWAPADTSSDLYGIPALYADQAWTKVLAEIPSDSGDFLAEDSPMTGTTETRTGRSYLIYPDIPDEGVSDFIELEYMVARQHSRDAFLAVRNLMLREFPEEISPVQVRWQQADSAFLSAQYERDTVSISVSSAGRSDNRFLRAVDRELRRWDIRPHWGKMHYLTTEQVRSAYPKLDVFLRIRRQLDPEGIFLNNHFRKLFGVDR